MSLAPLEQAAPTVIVDVDAPADAALVETVGGHRVLVLRESQSFSNAVTQITQLMPGMHPDRVRNLVRFHLPRAADFDSLESSWRSATPVTPTTTAPSRDDTPARRRKFLRKITAHAAVWSIATLAGVGYYAAKTPAREPFESAAFATFASLGNLMCDPIDSTHAKCTDVDGAVMLSSVWTGPDSTVFSFTYGSDKVLMRVFPTAKAAHAWTVADGNRGTYANIMGAGRYVFYGTDTARVRSYANAVADSGATDAAALPPRITALTMGALNLPGGDRIGLVSVTQENAVRAVLGEPAPGKGKTPKVERVTQVSSPYVTATADPSAPAAAAPMPSVGELVTAAPSTVEKIVEALKPKPTTKPTPTPTAVATTTQPTTPTTPTPSSTTAAPAQGAPAQVEPVAPLDPAPVVTDAPQAADAVVEGVVGVLSP